MIENKKNEKANLENKKNTFFLIGLVLALGTVLFAFEWKTAETNAVTILGTPEFVSDDYIFIPPTPAEKRELPKPIIKVPTFVVVDDMTDVSDEFELMSTEPNEEPLIDFNSIVFQSNEIEKEEIIHFTAEIMPEFPGGDRALLNYLSRNVKYPLIAQENGIEGKVYVSFIIDEQGDIYDVNLLRGVDLSLDNEALRVVKGMPKWNPGKQGGKPVKVRYSVPIYFDLR